MATKKRKGPGTKGRGGSVGLLARQQAYDRMPHGKAPHGHLYHRPGSNKK